MNFYWQDQTKNNYNKEVFNADIGKIIKLVMEMQEMNVSQNHYPHAQANVSMSVLSIQNLAKFYREILYRERLLDKMHSFIQHPVMCNYIFSIPGHEQPFEIWIQ